MQSQSYSRLSDAIGSVQASAPDVKNAFRGRLIKVGLAFALSGLDGPFVLCDRRELRPNLVACTELVHHQHASMVCG